MEKNSLILQFSLQQPLCPTEDSAPGIGEYYKISEKEEVTSTSSDLERINEKLKLRLNGVSNHGNVDTASTVKCQPFLLRNVCRKRNVVILSPICSEINVLHIRFQ